MEYRKQRLAELEHARDRARELVERISYFKASPKRQQKLMKKLQKAEEELRNFNNFLAKVQ